MGSNQLKSNLHLNKIQSIEGTDLIDKDKIVIRNASTESMECRNGSVESTDSSRLDWEEQLHDETNLELGSLSPPYEDDKDGYGSPDFRRDCLLPNELVSSSPRRLR